MKRIFTILAAAGLALGVQAQQSGHSNYIGLNLGGGLNTMTYSPNNGDQKLGLGFDAGLHYAHFFGEHIGLGFGVHYTIANAYATYNFNEATPGLTHQDNPGVTYTLNTTFNNWKERQNIGILGIPVELFYRALLSDKVAFIGGLGVQFDLPLNGKYSGEEGTYSTTGTFPNALGNYVVANMPDHGFGTYDNITNDKIDNIGFNVSAIIDLGLRFALGDNWGLYFGIYGGYGLNNMISEEKNVSMLVVNPNNSAEIDYHGTFASNEIDKANMLRAGVKIGIDLGWNCGNRDDERAAAEAAAAEAAAKAAAEKAAADKAAAEKAAADKAAAEKAAAEKAAADKAAAEQAAAERAAAERAAAERAAAERVAQNTPAEKAKAEAVKKIQAINATVYFETGKTDAKFDAKTDDAIHAICEALKADSKLKVTIYGHTDNTGSEEINNTLGEERAKALKYYMIQLGAPGLNINTVGRSSKEPVATNDTEEGRALNRRATVELK